MGKFWQFKNQADGNAELLLYGDIADSSWWGDGVTPKQFAEDLSNLGYVTDSTVRINSGGGDVFAAQAIGNQLEQHSANVTAKIDGLCASAATIIACHCNKVVAANDSTYMIHPVKMGIIGYKDAAELQQYLNAMAAIRDSILGLYAKKTGRSKDEVAQLMDATSWWTGEQAKAEGFVDELVDDGETAVIENRNGMLFVNSANFAVVPTAPLVLINVLDPKKHTGDITSATVKVNNGVAVLEIKGVLLDQLKVMKESTVLKNGTDYTGSFNDDGTVNIILLPDGKGNDATTLTVSGKKLDPSKVKNTDIIGGVDTSTGKETGLEVIRQVYPLLSMTPGILLAPRFSADPTVAAALQAKTSNINGVFKAVCIVDINSATGGATKYTDVKTQKEKQAVSNANAYAVWPYAKVGDVIYSGSSLAGALTAYTDASNDDTPNVSPSNKTLSISAMCLADGTEVLLDQEQANTINSVGVATFLNMNGFRLWGNNTAAYPGTTDPKDRWFSVRRFLNWAANTFILTYSQKVDSPANPRLIEAIVDSENVRGNGFVARGICARYEIRYYSEENTTTDLLDGKKTFHQYITPYTPSEDIEDIIEFDPDALAAALG